MAELNPPLYLNQDAAYGADELALPWRDVIGEGVIDLAGGHLAVAQRAAGANMSVDVALGSAWIHGDDDAEAQGAYRVRSDGTKNLAVAAADATNPRVDLVIAEVLDSVFAGVSDLWRLRIVQGTPAGAPTTPATPSNAIALATIAVAAGAGSIVTGNITDSRSQARPGGGRLGSSSPTRVTAAEFALLTPSDGDEVYLEADATNGRLWHLRYNAGSASAYKWEFLGGADLISAVITGNPLTTAWASYGAALTLPRAGDYEGETRGVLAHTGSGDLFVRAACSSGTVAPDGTAGGRAAADGSGIHNHTGTGKFQILGASAGATVNLQAHANPATSSTLDGRFWVRPIRLS